MNAIQTLFGGIGIEVTKRDGTTEKVTVRQLPIRLYERYLSVMDDEATVVELLCGKESAQTEETESVITAFLSLSDLMTANPRRDFSDQAREIAKRFRAAREQRWSDTLTAESVEKIIETGEEVNADFFQKWIPRRRRRAEKMQKSWSTNDRSENGKSGEASPSSSPGPA